MKIARFFGLVLVLIMIAALFPQGTALAQKDPIKTGAYPVLKSPHGTILDTTPSYKWNNSVGVDQFQYQVYQGLAKLLDKTVASSVCGVSTCTRTPNLPLVNQPYKWRVRAHLSSGWSAWSPFMLFTISAPSFDTQFNGTSDFEGWASKGAGTWDLYNNMYMRTPGFVNKWTSLYYTGGQYTNFDYSVRMYRYGNDPSYLGVRMGTFIRGSDSMWSPGYLFGYSNYLGSFAVYRVQSDGATIAIQDWITTPAAVINGWNTLRVVAKGSLFKYYINGTEVFSFTDNTHPRGYVGVTSFRNSTSSTYFTYLNWAKLTVIETPQ